MGPDKETPAPRRGYCYCIQVQTPFGSMARYENTDNRKFKKIVTPLDQTGVGALTA